MLQWVFRGPGAGSPRLGPRSGATGGHTTLLIVAHAARGFFRSDDQVFPASLCGVVATAKAAEVGRFSLGQ